MKKSRQVLTFLILVGTTILSFFLLDAFAKPNITYAKEYVVIVNKANDYKGQDEHVREIVKSLYLKKRSTWPDNLLSKPFAQRSDSEIHKVFLANVLKMTKGQLAEYWTTFKSKSGTKSPREVSSKMVMRLVSKYEGALGYVSKAEAKSNKGQTIILLEF